LHQPAPQLPHHARSSSFGDQVTAAWPLGNPNWINQGAPGEGLNSDGGGAYAILERFPSVIAQHPQIVHIMLGSVDSDLATLPTYLEYEAPNLMSDVQNMVKEAQAAHIQVVFGLEPQAASSGLLESFNSLIVSIAAANNIPVINYVDALFRICSSYTT